MAEGKLIVEVYEYAFDGTPFPKFEYIPCDIEKCFKRNRATLKEIIQRGLSHNPEKLKDTLAMVEKAGIDKIDVIYNKSAKSSEPYIELTNVVQLSISDADASRKRKKHQNDIILYGRYRLSDGTETTKLKDAQRLSLIYSTWSDGDADPENPLDGEDIENQKEICLNITFIQA